jgi:glycerol dehydrogenase
MDSVILGPAKYLRTRGALGRIGTEAEFFGERALVIGGKTALSVTRNQIEAAFAESGIGATFLVHRGECSRKMIEAYRNKAFQTQAQFIVAIGGGKALDSAKGAAHFLRLPLVTVPTIAATCAAWSALTVLYTETGKPDGQISTWRSPDLCLVDLDIFAAAPGRYLAAGMGDSIAKLHETTFNTRGMRLSVCSEATILASRLIYSLLESHGRQALDDVRRKEVTHDLEVIVDSNILLTGIASGLAGDEVRLSAAHALHNTILALYEEGEATLHGEKVAFGTVVQMILENKPDGEIRKVVKLLKELKLPVTIEDLKIKNSNAVTIGKLAEETVNDGLMKNSPVKIDVATMARAITKAQKFGEESR